MAKQLPPIDVLSSILDHDPVTGSLVWKIRPKGLFVNELQWARWNKHYAGTQAGRITSAGYRSIKVLGEAFQAHRIMWKLATGKEPGEIDHINRDKLDNRMANLRDVGRSLNMKNKGLTANNTSGHKHIHWMPRLSRWTVQMVVPGKGQRQLAWCETLEEAVQVRDRLYQELGYYK